MGAARIVQQLNQPRTLQPRDRIINIWSATENGIAQTDLVLSGFLVTTRELAEDCEVAGVEYVYVNPANILAMNVENRPVPPLAPPSELSLVPMDEEETEDLAEDPTSDPPESDEE